MVNQNKTQNERAVSEKDFLPVVGIGASAGGLEAIEKFLEAVPPEPDIALVIIQHLSPDHTSMMDSLLKKYTNMKISTIEDNTRIESNHVYLNPPNMEVALYKGVLHLQKPTKGHRMRTPIDHFFRSLAGENKSMAIGIILSGAGTDGTLGFKEIRGTGGLTIVQDPQEARYDLMPRNALVSDVVDFSLKAGDMFGKIREYIKHPYVRGRKQLDLNEEKFKDHLDQIYKMIKKYNGHDFSLYKPTTVLRRIERRLAIHKLDDLDKYVKYLEENPEEVSTLFKELLIKVTSFFRDPEAFEALKKEVIYGWVKTKSSEETLRIWVPACATGEEAYSVCILMLEAMKDLDKHRPIQIFATDIDEEAIETARMGEYRESISMDVSEDRLDTFFEKDNNIYRVKKGVREKIVFAVQNIIEDPPFSKMDLICCRNLLIYLDRTLQDKLVPLFHYSLKEGGYLFLGYSETIGSKSDLFSAVNSKYKIYRASKDKLKERPGYPPLPFSESSRDTPAVKTEKKAEQPGIRNLVQNVIINEYSPPAILINKDFDILYFSGDTEKYLLPPMGEPSFNFFDMARQGLRHQLSTKIRQAIKEHTSITCEDVPVKYGDKIIPTDVEVKPLREMGQGQNLFLILFRQRGDKKDTTAKNEDVGEQEEESSENVQKLKEELTAVKQYYQSAMEELQVTNEELRASNEELQSTNEELQSTNEEHETAKEELQSTNEELSTVNADLDNKIEELEQAYSDMHNLLASTEIATVFLNLNLKIKRFTPAVRKIFNLIPEDIGRPLSDIASKIPYSNVIEDAQEVLDTLERKEINVRTEDGSRFSLRILPYRTTENVIDGVVLTFIDISRLIESEKE